MNHRTRMKIRATGQQQNKPVMVLVRAGGIIHARFVPRDIAKLLLKVYGDKVISIKGE